MIVERMLSLVLHSRQPSVLLSNGHCDICTVELQRGEPVTYHAGPHGETILYHRDCYLAKMERVPT